MPTTTSRLESLFLERTQRSRELSNRARTKFPSAVTHDARYLSPYGIFVERASGARKWDVDGNEYVDYIGGHGALLLGHGHPQVIEAAQRQIGEGTHYGSSHEQEVEWAATVQRLLPSAERVRFTSSGTEATMLAIRLARAFTGHSKIIRFNTNFHGWHDHVAFGVASHHDGTPTPGILPAIADEVVLCPPGDICRFRELLADHADVAAVIVEPTGATWGQVPIPGQFLKELESELQGRSTLLILDEVVTGFRVSPGGAQAQYSIAPDLTTLAKILAGGFPGGAVVGRKDVLDLLDFEASTAGGREKITHQGTFNANPVSAAAGNVALQIVETSDACQRASDYARRLRQALQDVVEHESLSWRVYGDFSGFHVFTNPEKRELPAGASWPGPTDYKTIKAAAGSALSKRLRLGMLAHGVDLFGWPGGITSSAHGDAELERTVDAFSKTTKLLKEEGL